MTARKQGEKSSYIGERPIVGILFKLKMFTRIHIVETNVYSLSWNGKFIALRNVYKLYLRFIILKMNSFVILINN